MLPHLQQLPPTLCLPSGILGLPSSMRASILLSFETSDTAALTILANPAAGMLLPSYLRLCCTAVNILPAQAL